MKKKTENKELKEGQPVWWEGKVYTFLKEKDGVYYRKDFSGNTYYSDIAPKPLTEKEFLTFMELELGWRPYLGTDMLKLDGESRFYVTKEFSKGKKTWQLCYEPFQNEEGDCTDGIWENTEELEDSIVFLQEAKVIIDCLNLTL